MLSLKGSVSVFRVRTASIQSLLYAHVKYYNRKIDTVAKRGSMLLEFIKNKDKRSKWHLNIVPDKPKVRAFEKVHKPHRRRAVLNSLFIHNITDVISTGDIIPELANYKVEITGVRISPCFKMLNVFWQVPVNQFESSDEIANLLTIAAPKIRAELTSRNVLGRVPFIYFLRDCTNEKIAAFEKAMENLDLGPESESPIVADDEFIEDIYVFNSAKVERKKKTETILDDRQELTHLNEDDTKVECNDPAETKVECNDPPETKLECNDLPKTKTKWETLPEKSAYLKCDIFGLNRSSMMEKIIALKKTKKGPPTKTALISLDSLKDGDLFDKIPGVCFVADSYSSRNDILKRFTVERKMLMKKKIEPYGNHHCDAIIKDTDDDEEFDTYEEDFIDEDEATKN